jgi:hypothetical protein
MNPKAPSTWFLVLAAAGLAGCSSDKQAQEAKKAAPVMHTITGKLQAMPSSTGTDAALNAGGDSLFIRNGVRRYRLFLKAPVEVSPGTEYTVEGIFAQKAIDEIGDPAQGKSGYPLAASCQRVIRMAWGSQAMDVADSHASLLRAQVSRYPARPVFLVTKITPAPAGDGKKSDDDAKELPAVSVPAAKQAALRIAGVTELPAPLWAPEGGVARCKVVIDEKGMISDLDTGAQLCEAVPWADFRYPPPVQGSRPVRVKTEVEVRFTPKK